MSPWTKANVGLIGELLTQDGNQPLIQFDGHDASGLFGQVMGQCAEAGTNLEHCVGWCEVGGVGDTGQMGRVDEEVLAEGFFQVQIVPTDQFEGGGEVVMAFICGATIRRQFA